MLLLMLKTAFFLTHALLFCRNLLSMIADVCCISKMWENKRREKTSKYATVSNSLIFLISCELRSFCVNLTMRSLHCLYRACLESTRISRGLTLPEERARFVYGSFNTTFSPFKWGKINRFTFVSHYAQYMCHKYERLLEWTGKQQLHGIVFNTLNCQEIR